ncbi:MAG: hypothetical protein GY820_00925 [Gammaproteobacteria bacterium]|nr:hypothetical protein [Gammaproteobacteria bacterium]
MKAIQLFLFFTVNLGLASQVQASDFEAALSSETAQFTFRSDSSLIGWGGADFGVGLFYNEDSDFVMQAELLQARQASSGNPLTLGVGVKAYAGRLDTSGEEVFALGIGGEIKYTFAGLMPMALYLRGYLAPEITSFMETRGITDYLLGFQIEVLPQTTAFIGIHQFEVDTESQNEYEVDDDEIHLGVRLTF